MTSYLPRLSYFTFCDEYIMSSFYFLTGTLLQNGVAGYFALKADADDDDDKQQFSDEFSNVTEWLIITVFATYNLNFIYRCRRTWQKTHKLTWTKEEISATVNCPYKIRGADARRQRAEIRAEEIRATRGGDARSTRA